MLVTGTLRALSGNQAITGTYASPTVGVGCSTGSFSAWLVLPITGSLTGSGVPTSGNGKFYFNVNISEDPNTGYISGNVTYSSLPCLSNLTLNGYVIGTTTHIMDPTGPFILFGTWVATRQISGTYQISSNCQVNVNNETDGSFTLVKQ